MRKLLCSVLAGAALATFPPSIAQAASKSLGITMRYQEKSNWCWAACTQMILSYYQKFFAEQCEIVEIARQRNPGQWGTVPSCLNPDQNCCAKDACACGNRGQPNNMTPFDAGSTREILNFHTILAGGTNGVLSYADAKARIDASLPFITRWAWTSGGGHAVLVTGYSDATTTQPNQLRVQNPAWNEGISWTSYNAVVTPPNGNWDATMPVTGYRPQDDTTYLYQHDSFGGSLWSSPRDGVSYVGDTFNDQASSARVYGVPYILYADSNNGGVSWPLTPQPYSSYTAWNGANDAVSSVRRMPGDSLSVGLVLFEGENFTGNYQVLSSDDYNLHNSGWGDRVSSLIVVSKVWNLYQNADLGGMPYAVTSFGGPGRNGFYPNPASWGGPDNDISSANWIPESWNPVLLYEHPDFGGRAVAVRSSASGGWLNDFQNMGFNDMVSSIKTLGGTWTVYNDSNQRGGSYVLSPNRWYRQPSDWGGAHDQISSLKYAAFPAW